MIEKIRYWFILSVFLGTLIGAFAMFVLPTIPMFYLWFKVL